MKFSDQDGKAGSLWTSAWTRSRDFGRIQLQADNIFLTPALFNPSITSEVYE